MFFEKGGRVEMSEFEKRLVGLVIAFLLAVIIGLFFGKWFIVVSSIIIVILLLKFWRDKVACDKSDELRLKNEALSAKIKDIKGKLELLKNDDSTVELSFDWTEKYSGKIKCDVRDVQGKVFEFLNNNKKNLEEEVVIFMGLTFKAADGKIEQIKVEKDDDISISFNQIKTDYWESCDNFYPYKYF